MEFEAGSCPKNGSSNDPKQGRFDCAGLCGIKPLFFSAFLVVLICGCVSDDVEQYDPVAAYQRTLVYQGVQQRIDYGLNLLKPTANEKLPELKSVTDPNTGKKVFHLTIEQAIVRTLANSPEIKIVSFDPQISKEEITKAAAEFDPTFFERFNYTDNDRPNNQILTDGTIIKGGQSISRIFEVGIKRKNTIGSEWSLAWALTRNWDNSEFSRFNTRYEPMITFQINQPLLRDGWEQLNLAGVNISKLNYRAALASFRQNADDIATRIIATYWLLVEARENLDIQQLLLEQTRDTLKKVTDRKDIDATAVQIKQVETSLHSRRADFFDTQKRIEDVQDALVLLMSDSQLNLLSEAEIIPSSIPETSVMKLQTRDTLELAMRNNPVIHQARLDIDIAEINIEVAKNQKMPRLDLVASTNIQGFADDNRAANESLRDSDFTSYMIGITFEVPIGNRQRRAELRLRQLDRSRKISALQNISDQVAADVKERIRLVRTSYKQMAEQAKAVGSAKIYLKALEDTEPIRGKLTPEYLLVKLQAQESLARAKSAHIRAIVDFNIALARLAKAVGTVLQLHHVQPAIASIEANTTEPTN